MHDQTPPVLAFESLEGADRETAEHVIGEVVRAVTDAATDDGTDRIDHLSAALRTLRAEAIERDGEVGEVAFRDSLTLLGWLLHRHRRQEPAMPAPEA